MKCPPPAPRARRRAGLLGGVAAATLVLSACGDGPAGPPSAPQAPVQATEVPASATASTAAWTSFAAGLVPSESARALDVNRVTPPTSETEPPAAI